VRTLQIPRTLLVGAAVVGFATAIDAATLTVDSLNSSNLPQNTFNVGDTIILKVTGDSQGGMTGVIYGPLFYDGAIAHGIAVSQSTMLANQDPLTTGGSCGGAPLPPSWQCAVVFAQTTQGPLSPPSNPILTATLTLIADEIGVSQVGFNEGLDFFDLYIYGVGNHEVLHSFTVVPEPATAVSIGMGLLAVAGWRRSRA
jgi:hypothetical protein